MRALVKRSDADVELELVDVSERPLAPAEVRVAVAACGVCGTDLHILEGGYRSHPPVVLGHEVSGTVVETGTADADWLGARVALSTFFSTCGACRYCRSGRPNLCADRRSIGSGADGGFAERIVIPVANLHRLPDGIGLAAGALAEPLACVCQSLMDPVRITEGDRVLVTGPGPVGLLAAQVARHLGGIVTVAGTERDAVRLASASALGFDVALSEHVPLDPAWDTVVECSGAGAAMALCLEVLRPGGTYVQMGQTDRAVSVRLALLSFKELQLSGGFASTPKSWARAMVLLADDAIDLESLVTEIAPIEDWRRIFDATARADGLKFLLSPGTR
jgi:L-iditol 2-dehydrogenase